MRTKWLVRLAIGLGVLRASSPLHRRPRTSPTAGAVVSVAGHSGDAGMPARRHENRLPRWRSLSIAWETERSFHGGTSVRWISAGATNQKSDRLRAGMKRVSSKVISGATRKPTKMRAQSPWFIAAGPIRQVSSLVCSYEDRLSQEMPTRLALHFLAGRPVAQRETIDREREQTKIIVVDPVTPRRARATVARSLEIVDGLFEAF